ncbi:MAG: paraquat-inducible protein A [Planctomycetota bacterium]
MQPLAACHCCGRVHRLPDVPARSVACCVRCDAVIRHAGHPRSSARTAAFASAALIIYPFALTWPVVRIERLGHTSDASIWSGMIGLLAEGHIFVGLIVLLFSIIAPISKLVLLFALCAGRRALEARDRARTYRLIEFIGRWGMVDVLLVAVLVAAVKLGDLVQVTPGPGVVAFGVVVLLSLIASMVFDPHAIWEDSE